MMFTIGVAMMILGLAVGHLFGDARRNVFNPFDIAASTLFVLGLISVLSSIFTITWKYMP